VSRFLRYLATWSASQLLIVSALWIVVVILGAFLTPPVRQVLAVNQLAEMMGPVNVALPVDALRLVAILTPMIALVPPLIIFLLWRRVRRARILEGAA